MSFGVVGFLLPVARLLVVVVGRVVAGFLGFKLLHLFLKVFTLFCSVASPTVEHAMFLAIVVLVVIVVSSVRLLVAWFRLLLVFLGSHFDGICVKSFRHLDVFEFGDDLVEVGCERIESLFVHFSFPTLGGSEKDDVENLVVLWLLISCERWETRELLIVHVMY